MIIKLAKPCKSLICGSFIPSFIPIRSDAQIAIRASKLQRQVLSRMNSFAGQHETESSCAVCSDQSRPYKNLHLREEYRIVCQRCKFLSTVVRKAIEDQVFLYTGLEQVIRWYERTESDTVEDGMVHRKRWSDFKLGETPNTRFELFTLAGLYPSALNHGQDLTSYKACQAHFQTSL